MAALLRVVRPLAAALVLLSLAAGVFFGWQHVALLLHSRPEYQSSWQQVRYTVPPAWVRRDVLREVRNLTELGENFSLLDDHVARRLAEAFGQHPCVERVDRVQLGRDGLWHVRLRYRSPVAMVETPTGLLPVDGIGTLLPAQDFTPGEASRYPILRGVEANPPNTAGRKWSDPLVAGGARIAEVLAPHWEALGLEAIQAVFWAPQHGRETKGRSAEGAEPGVESGESSVESGRRSAHPRQSGTRSTEQKREAKVASADRSSAQDGSTNGARDGTFYLLSRAGTRVVWGRPPDTDHPGEIPAADKIARLKDYVAKHGSLEGPAGPYELDVRHWQEISRRPRASASSQ